MTVSPTYAYSASTQLEVEHMLRGALGPSVSFARAATLADDFHGIDLWYVTSFNVPVQVRMRYDRPAYAPDDDVSFRTTERAMIRERTYAPLMAFGWLRQGRLIAGKLIDVYQMAARIDPPLDDRLATLNDDRKSAFVTVSIDELYAAKALLRVGDPSGWANALSDSDARLRRIIDRYAAKA